ncbi:hypothetical protein ASPVEDRAFT_50748 [Aspergillus versicolor CBS 583.65]|uniref:BTB domain-containing protein n=1 Tax=Aspergillus versicolor CBS 583.65 TaxID=1036611 RepID=A0A1L9PCM8_ASPVE|nr:uncharacterized protein ASPVEDRAFT_50748 [Aspergillus versicolor CBS 583.65]OJI99232.1 hypothetical protein ASPVEDRAFT_50748 [Aspergillus versicolor CBS 583.65]
MDPPTHIIDPDGEVIIVLCNSNSHFAEPAEDMSLNGFSHTDDIHIPPEEIEPPEPTPEPIQLPTEEPAPEPPTEYSVHEEPVPEELVPEEPVPEEPVPEEPVPEEPVPEEGVVEESAEQTEEQAESDLEDTCFRIQVSAKHLILASSVFKKILTGGWKESVTFLKERSVEITAEGWDIEALLILLRAIHGQQYHIPRKLTLEMLAKIAVLVDYYDCKEAVYIWTTIWIKSLEEKIPVTYCRDLFLWLWVSWAFQLPTQFKETTSTIMSSSDGGINSFGLPIPAEVIEAINKQRQENIDRLVGLIHDKHGELLTGFRGCCFECSSIMYGALTREMHKVGLLSPRPAAPFVGWSRRGLVQKIRSFRDPQWILGTDISSYRRTYSSDYHECLDSSFASIFGKPNETTQGLDLVQLFRI